MAFAKMVICAKNDHPVMLVSHKPKPLGYVCGPCAAGVEFVKKVPTGGLKTKREKA